jgi:hypothetical protein
MEVSMSSVLAGWASELLTRQVRTELSVAVLKQILDQQQRQGEDLVRMIANGPRPASPEHLVDRYA